MSKHDAQGQWIKGEVERRAQLSYEKAQKAHEQLNNLMVRREAFTPTAFREAVATQYSNYLWSRTNHYLKYGSDEATAVLTGDRQPDTADPITALRNLITGVLPPSPYRNDDRWPMDQAFHRIEMQAWEDWKRSCEELLTKEPARV
ncbi:hypothetical protein ACWEQ1_17425 [Streptomyces nodosus]